MVTQIVNTIERLITAMSNNHDFEAYTSNNCWEVFQPDICTLFNLKKDIALGNIRIGEINPVNTVTIRMNEHGLACCGHYSFKLENSIKHFMDDMRRLNPEWAVLLRSDDGYIIHRYEKEQRRGKND